MTPKKTEAYDAVVVGGGIAGISVAYELASSADVVLLEMENVLAYHSTGRSAAMFLETYGGPDIRALTVGGRRFLEDPPEAFERTLLSPRALLQIAKRGRGAVVEQLFADVSRDVPDAYLMDNSLACELCPYLKPGAIDLALFEPFAKEMDVDALHQGYLRGYRARGGEVRRNSQVVRLTRTSGVWTVATADGSFFAAPVVINAAGAWADKVASAAGISPIGLVPKLRTAFTTAAPDGLALEGLPMVYDIDESFYAKPEGAQMLCSPADKTPTEALDARPDTLEIARSLDDIREITTIPARAVRASWAGLRTFSPDDNLVVGKDPRAPGFVWLAGQGGYGVQTAPGLSRLAASIVREEDPPVDLVSLGLQPDRLDPCRFV